MTTENELINSASHKLDSSDYVIDSTLSIASSNPVQNGIITVALNGKLDSTAYVVDTTLSSSSTNPVENSVLYSALEGKLDIDASNLSSTGKANITTLPMPSPTHVIELQLDANKKATAPADGYVTVAIDYASSYSGIACYCGLYSNGYCYTGQWVQYNTSNNIRNSYSMPVHAGESFSVGLSGGYRTSDIVSVRFWYAQGVTP